MNTSRRPLVIAAALLLAACPLAGFTPAHAQVAAAAAVPAVSLKVGDKAPAMKIGAWVKGEVVKEFSKDRVYVVEFWATWCGPCKRSIPHLTELQAKHKDKLTIIGVSVWENTAGSGMSQDAVEKKVRDFVTAQGAAMEYTVAVDDATSEMARTWLAAAGMNGIPAAFVIGKDGLVNWIGNPLTPDFDEALSKILDGSFDVKAEARKRAEEAARVERFNAAMARVSTFQQEGKIKEAIESLEASMKDENDPQVKGALIRYKFNLLLMSDEPAAYALGRELLAGELKDAADELAQIGELISMTETLKTPDLALAASMGERASEVTQGKNPTILHRLASIYAKKGDYQKAIDSQKAAIARMKEQMGEEKAAPMASFMQSRIDQWTTSLEAAKK